MFTVYDYMKPTTLADVVAAARRMMRDGDYDVEQFAFVVNTKKNATKALVANVGKDEAQKMIDAAMESAQ